MAEQVTVSEPAYVSRFRCIGERCEDHCCHSWEVTLDKRSYQRLRRSTNPRLSTLATRSLKLLREGDERHARISMSAHENCPFLDGQRLCTIQRLAGHEALPRTCRSYPRSNSLIAGSVEKSLSLSCPEAARLILLDPDALLIEQYAAPLVRLDIHNHFAADARLDWLPRVRQFCFDTLLDESLAPEEQLFVIGLFLRRASPELADGAALERLSAVFAEPQTRSQLRDSFRQLAPAPSLLWEVFSTVANGIMGQQQISTLIAGGQSVSEQRFLALHRAVAAAVADPDGAAGAAHDPAFAVQRLRQGYATHYRPFFAANGHILRNYLLYQVYHYMFPLHATRTPFECYRLLVVEFFMLRAYLCGLALVHGGLSEALVVELVQSWSRKRQHNRGFEDALEAMLASAHAGAPDAIFGLLGLAGSSEA